MSNTLIEWTDVTWNPVRGCTRVSKGCTNCYAERIAVRMSGPGQWGEGFADVPRRHSQTGAATTGVRGHWTGKVELVPSKLDEPLRWRRPRKVFVNSMSDLFHEALPDEAIEDVFAVMALAPWHTFQVLTKRASRMRAWALRPRIAERMDAAVVRVMERGVGAPLGGHTCFVQEQGVEGWPLPNVWLGVSVEDQATADERIPLLLQTPAAKRFVSYEPALGPVDFGLSQVRCSCCPRPAHRWVRVTQRVEADFAFLMRDSRREVGPGVYRAESNPHGALSVGGLGIKPAEFERLPGLDQIIFGGESGPGARSCEAEEWARAVIVQCRAAGAAPFIKQMGSRWARAKNTGRDRNLQAMFHTKGGEPSEWPEDLRVREFPR